MNAAALLWSAGAEEASLAAWRQAVASLPPTLVQVIGIVREGATAVQRWLAREGVQVILRPEAVAEDSRILRLGLQALKHRATGVLFYPVGPKVAAASVTAILEAGAAAPAAIVRLAPSEPLEGPLFCPRELTTDLYLGLPLPALPARYPERLIVVSATPPAGSRSGGPPAGAKPRGSRKSSRR